MYNPSKTCYLCGSENYKIIHNGVRGNADIDVLKCCKCGLVRLNEFISDTDEYYQNSQMRKNEELDINKIRITAAQDDERRFEYTKGLISNKRLLDFGCGAGGYLLRAKQISDQIYGIELEERMRNAICKEGIKVYKSIDEVKQNLSSSVDVVSMWHVLEHLENPIEILGELKCLLNANGRIIIEVPNADDALISLYDCKAFQNFTYWEAHLFLYTIETLKEIIKKAGLQIHYITQIQRYSLSNHLYWLTKGEPGGHNKWNMMNDKMLDKEYANRLISNGIADTIIVEAGL